MNITSGVVRSAFLLAALTACSDNKPMVYITDYSFTGIHEKKAAVFEIKGSYDADRRPFKGMVELDCESLRTRGHEPVQIAHSLWRKEFLDVAEEQNHIDAVEKEPPNRLMEVARSEAFIACTIDE